MFDTEAGRKINLFTKKVERKSGGNELCYIYRIRTNIGEELNLANWRITMQSPSLNLTNIFFYSISIVTLVAFE